MGLSGIYVLVTAAVFGVVRHGQGVEQASFFDLLLPPRWPNYRITLGEHQFRLAEKSAASGNRREAHIRARAGLARSPANRDGRLLLARLYLDDGRPDDARKILLEGFEFHRNDPLYLQPLFNILLQQQQDSVAFALVRSLLAAQPPIPERNRLAAQVGATICFLRSELDQAEDFLQRIPSLTSSREGRLLMAKIDYVRGYRELALVSLRSLAVEHPHDSEIHHELIRRLRESGARDEARRCSLLFQITHPALAHPRIELLTDLLDSGESERAAHEIDALVRDFAADPDALLALAEFAVRHADPKLARRLFEHARAHALPPEPHALLVVESLVAAHDHRGALDAADTLTKEFPAFAARFDPLLNSLRGIAYYGLGETETGRLLISHYLNQPYLRAENLVAVAHRLLDVNAPLAAHNTLSRAVAADPSNQAALTRLVELDLDLNCIDELPTHLQRLLTMRQPSPDILRVAQHKLGSDLFLLSEERSAALAAVRAALERQPPARSSR